MEDRHYVAPNEKLTRKCVLASFKAIVAIAADRHSTTDEVENSGGHPDRRYYASNETISCFYGRDRH